MDLNSLKNPSSVMRAPMKLTDLGKVTKCMNPNNDCPNVPDPSSSYVVVHQDKPLVLCRECGPEFQLKKAFENVPDKRGVN
jgi:hypothetical protein